MTQTRQKWWIALGQMTSVDDIDANLQQIQKHCERAADQKAKALFLPENAIYMRLIEGQKIAGLPLSHPAFGKISQLANQHSLTIHLGSVPLATHGHLFNASVLCEPLKDPRVTYKKVHLFDISLEDQRPIRESDIFKHGPDTEVLHLDGWSLGQSICYDVRFAELYLRYAKIGVDALLVPSAFLVTTGKKHWEVLLRARAIESQSYVLAPAQAGLHMGKSGAQRETFGHSLIIDPWGEIIKQGSGDKEETLVAELDPARIAQVRRQIPMKDHRRLI